jgi:hypothetical protein
MSKKLIAVASAAALALSAFVATPANAGAFAVAVAGTATGDGIASTTAYSVPVPSTDVIRYVASGGASSNTALELDVEVTATGGTATFTATGGVRLINATQLADADGTLDTKTGTTSLSVTAAATEALAYAYNSSTTAGTVIVSNGGNSRTIYIIGASTKAYKVTASGSTFASKGVIYEASIVVADMFGNPITALADSAFEVTGLGAFASNITEALNITETTTKGTYLLKVPAAEVANIGTGLLQITTVAGSSYLTDSDFADLSIVATVSVNSSAPETTIAALQAQVIKLTADYAALEIIKDRKVSKIKYNRVARKWNAAFPSQKVWVKP